MLNLNKLPVEITELMSQLVSQGDINLLEPISDSTTYWADFFDQHPDECQISDRPYFFMYGFQFANQFRSLEDDDWICTYRFGLDVPFEVEQAHKKDVNLLWYTARSFFNTRNGQTPLKGSYTVGSNVYRGINLSMIGIRETSFNSNVEYRTNKGKIFRYDGLLEMTLNVRDTLNTFNQAITTPATVASNTLPATLQVLL